nr:hypothetical protein [Tanacetum cinerariifolium]
MVARHKDQIVAWRRLEELLECQTSSMLTTKELEAVMNQKRQWEGGSGRLVVVVVVDVNIGAFIEDAGLRGERSMIGVDSGEIEEEA